MFMTSMAMIEGLQLRICVGVANVGVANLLSWALRVYDCQFTCTTYDVQVHCRLYGFDTSVVVLGVRVECTSLKISLCFFKERSHHLRRRFSFSIHHPSSSSSFDCRLSAATPRHTVVANSRIGKCAVAVGVRLCCEFCGKMSLKRRTATRGLICALVFGLLSSSVSFASPFSWFVMCMCGHMVFADDCGRDDANSWCLCIMATVVFIFSQYCLSYHMPDSTLLYGTGTNQPRI